MDKKFQLFTLKNITDSKSTLTPIELKDYIDFEVKRVYHITHMQAPEIGGHCHYAEKELFVLIQGTCTAVIDQGHGLEDISMEGPKHAIYVDNYVWHGFKDFSEDAILLALSSTNYNPDRSDYIEDYEEYLKIRDEKLV